MQLVHALGAIIFAVCIFPRVIKVKSEPHCSMNMPKLAHTNFFGRLSSGIHSLYVTSSGLFC